MYSSRGNHGNISKTDKIIAKQLILAEILLFGFVYLKATKTFCKSKLFLETTGWPGVKKQLGPISIWEFLKIKGMVSIFQKSLNSKWLLDSIQKDKKKHLILPYSLYICLICLDVYPRGLPPSVCSQIQKCLNLIRGGAKFLENLWHTKKKSE